MFEKGRGAYTVLEGPKHRAKARAQARANLESVRSGNEARITLEANSKADYRENLEVELATIRDSEMWRAGAAVRSLRPENWKK